jgi:hypothetical protein
MLMSVAAVLTKEKLIAEILNSETPAALDFPVRQFLYCQTVPAAEKFFLLIFVTWLRVKFFFMNTVTA